MNEEELIEETTEEETEETSEEETEEESEEASHETIDYDRIESIVQEASTPSTFETALNDLAVTDVLMIILALVLGVLIVKARS